MKGRPGLRWLLLFFVVIFGLGAAIPLQAGGESGSALLLEEIIRLVREHYREPVPAERLWRGAIRGALEAVGDPYTTYMDPDEYRAFQDSIEQRLVGIGVRVEMVGSYLTVTSPIKGSPAEKAGILAGDRILAVDGTSVVGLPLSEAVGRIHGKAGTPVRLKIERPKESRVFEVTITRAEVQVPVVETATPADGVGLIRIHSFNESLPALFDGAYQNLRRAGVRGLILDLRDNPGGFLDSSLQLAGRFIPRGRTVVVEVGRDGKRREIRSPGSTDPIRLPVVVLVNGGSASASEVLAGALQDYGLATVVGTTTFGKGSIQQQIPVTGGGVLKITVARYLTPGGREVDGHGLDPDVRVEPLKPDPARTGPLTFSRVLRTGTVGLDVLAVQQRLNDLGLAHLSEDGVYGPATEQAVRALQRSLGLPETGVVDAATLGRLNERVAQRAHELTKRDVQEERAVQVLREKIGRAAA